MMKLTVDFYRLDDEAQDVKAGSLITRNLE